MDSPLIGPVMRARYGAQWLAAAVDVSGAVHTLVVAGLPLRVYGWARAQGAGPAENRRAGADSDGRTRV